MYYFIVKWNLNVKSSLINDNIARKKKRDDIQIKL